MKDKPKGCVQVLHAPGCRDKCKELVRKCSFKFNLLVVFLEGFIVPTGVRGLMNSLVVEFCSPE